MKSIIAVSAVLLSICLNIGQADGFLCTPYQNGAPASGTIYCAYINNASIEWEIWGSIYSDGTAKRFCKNVDSADVRIPYSQTYKFCAWNGVYRSSWTPPVLYEPGVSATYNLEMNIYSPSVPDPKEEE